MARVPTPDGFSVSPQSSPTTLRLDPSGALHGLGEITGSLESMGKMAVDHAVFLQNQENKTAADAANTAYINKTSDLLYSPDGGYYTLKDKAAVDAYPQLQDNLESARSDLEASLPNQQSRLLFQSESRRLQSYTMMDAARHAATERKNWMKDVSSGRQVAIVNNAALNYNNEEIFAKAQHDLEDEVMRQGAIDNKPVEWVHAEVTKQTSNLWSARISRLWDDDPRAASIMFQDNIDKLDAEDQVRIGRSMKSYVQTRGLQGMARTIMGGLATGDNDAIWEQTKLKESGGKQFKPDGTPQADFRTGTHFGVSQIGIPEAKAMAIKFGVPFDFNRLKTDEKYNDALGRAYFNEQLQNFNGNPAVALAAYNAGPKTALTWLARFGDPSNGDISTEEWVNKIPYAETKEYVSTILEKSGGVSRTLPTSEDPKDHLEAWLAKADAATGDDLDSKEKLQRMITTQVNRMSSAVRSQRNDAMGTLITAINGGPLGKDSKMTSIDQVQADATLKQAYSMLDWKGQQTILHDLLRNAAGNTQRTPEEMDLANSFRAMAQTDPLQFLSQNFTHEMRLTATDRNTLAKMQTKIPKNPSLRHALSIAAQMPGYPAKWIEDPKDATKDIYNPAYNAFNGKMLDQIETFNAVHGRNPNDADLRKIANGLMLNRKDAVPEYLHPLTTHIPLADKRQIAQAFYRGYGRAPTGEEIAAIYRRATAPIESRGTSDMLKPKQPTAVIEAGGVPGG